MSDLAANEDIGAVAANLNMDVAMLTKFMTAMKLVNGDNARVIVTPQKAARRKPKPKADVKAAAMPATQDLVNVAHVSKRTHSREEKLNKFRP